MGSNPRGPGAQSRKDKLRRLAAELENERAVQCPYAHIVIETRTLDDHQPFLALAPECPYCGGEIHHMKYKTVPPPEGHEAMLEAMRFWNETNAVKT